MNTETSDPPRSTAGRTEHRAYHSRDDPARLSTTVAHLLADVMGVDARESEFRLYDSVDPAALDRLFRPAPDGTSRSFGHVAFTVRDCRVTVYSDGWIVVTPPVDAPARDSAQG